MSAAATTTKAISSTPAVRRSPGPEAESPCASAATPADSSPEGGTLTSGDVILGVGAADVSGGAELNAIDGSRPSALPGLITVTLVLVTGSGTNGGTVVGRNTGAGVVGGAPDDAARVEDLDDVGVGFGLVVGGAVTLTELAAIGRLVIGGLVAAWAVAVSDTDVVPLAGAVTVACMVNVAGVFDVASGPSSQPAPPFPLGHIPLNTPRVPDGPALRLTHAEGVGPYGAHTFTVNDAAWPPWTLDCARVTLTHNAGGVEDADKPAAPADEEEDEEADEEDADDDADEAEADEEADEEDEDDVAGDGDGGGGTGRYSHCAPGGNATAATATLPPGQATTANTTTAAEATARQLRVRTAGRLVRGRARGGGGVRRRR